MAKQGIILGAVIAAGVAAVGGGLYWSSQQPHRFVFNVELYNIDRTGILWPETKVLVNGAEAPLHQSPEADAATLTAQGGLAKEYSDEVLPRIEVQYHYACGWKPVHLEMETIRDDDIKDAVSRGRNIPLRIDVKEDGWLDLHTDNRGQPAHRVELGGIVADLDKDSSKSLHLLQDTRCAAGSEVQLDGRSIGKLPNTPAPSDGANPDFLFDTSGKRCYTYRETSYVDDKFPDISGTHVTPRVVDLAPGYFHALPNGRIDYFLHEAPETIVVPQNMAFPGAAFVRTSLVETTCSAPSPAPSKRKAR
jgi:hypothetical protein